MHLGAADYRVLLALRDGAQRPASNTGEDLRIGDATVVSRAVVAYLESQSLIEIVRPSNGGNGADEEGPARALELRITTEGLSALEQEVGRAWMFDREGYRDDPPQYWFECPDPISGHRFVIDVHAAAGHHRAAQLALLVGRNEEVRAAAREIDDGGPDNGTDWEVDGTTVWIWRSA